MAERSVKVTLSAQVQGYIEGMEKAGRATRETGSEAEKLVQQSQAFEQMGRYAMFAGGAIAAGLALSTKAAIDWDSAWAGVTKTVDGTPEQMAAVEQGLRDLTAVLPASHSEIAAVAEAAGQLGIQTGSIVEFTRTMIDLGETTNLTAEESATQLARFMTVMGTAQDDVSGLGSALVELGNNYATTEAEILAMSMRLSGAGAQIGMSEGQILGLSTALSSVGIEAEAGGSAMSKVMIDIASSVDKGGSRLQAFAEVAGVSASDFANHWKNDPGEALALFVKGLANAEAQGKSTFGILEELGISEVRMRDALLRSASAADQFSDAMATGNRAMKENTALSDEAEKRYETTAAKLDIMKNRIVDAAIAVGENFLPAIELGAEVVGDLADMLAGLEGPAAGVAAWVGAIGGAILLTGGMAMAAVPKIAAYKLAVETLGAAGRRTDAILKGLGRATGVFATVGLAQYGITAFANEMTEKMMPAAEDTTNKVLTAKSAVDSFASVLEARLPGTGDKMALAAEQVEGLSAALQDASSASWWSPMKVGSDELLASWRLIGKELAATDFDVAREQFQRITKEAGLTREETAELINQSDEFKKTLTDQATAMGLSADEASLLTLAMQKVSPAADKAAKSAEEQAAALDELQGKATSTEIALDELADAIRGFGSAELDARAAARDLEAAFDDLTQSVIDNGLSLDINTDKGRSNEAALDAIVRAALESAAATAEQTGSQEEANAVLQAGRDRLIEMLAQFGITGEAADEYVNKLGLVPENIDTAVGLTGIEQAEQDLNWLTRPRQSLITILYGEGNQPPEQEWHAPMAPRSANGNIFEFANGGGLETGIYAGGPPITRFAEPETIWEAFISGKPDQRDRNRQIWVETGERLGMNPSGEQVINVFVQNPFTGKYLLDKMGGVANGVVDELIEQQRNEARR